VIPYTKLKDHNRNNLRDVIPLIKPYTLIIEPTNMCNFRCVQCFQSIREDNYFNINKIPMNLDYFNEIIEQMKHWKGPKLKVLKLSLYGEPLMNPDFCRMLKIAKEAEIAERIETTTNASLLNEEICAKIVENGLDYMRVSIYSAIEDRHKTITNSQISVKKIHDNLLTLKKSKEKYNSVTPFVGVKMLDTYGEENDIFEDTYRDVADEIYIDKPHNWIPYKEKDFIRDLYGNELEKAKKDLKESSSNRVACTLPFYTLAVRSNGDVSPCCIDWIGGTNIGSIKDERLENIWYGDNMLCFRKMQLENRKRENISCSSCQLYLNDYYTRDNIDGFPVEKLKYMKG
jgi:radical SAM protein with 4Fe4S-binding SPASM domain